MLHALRKSPCSLTLLSLPLQRSSLYQWAAKARRLPRSSSPPALSSDLSPPAAAQGQAFPWLEISSTANRNFPVYHSRHTSGQISVSEEERRRKIERKTFI